jgi:hypothetical protein
MDIQLKKLEIIEWLTKISENNIIDEIWSIKSKYVNSDEEQVLNELLEQSKEDIISGNVISHDQVMREMREKYGIKTD